MTPNITASPLTQHQKTVWKLIGQGLSVSCIANKLKTTRQYVNQTRLTAEAKLSNTLMEVAQVNDLQIIRLYSKQAILVGFHPALKRKAIVTYSTNYGVKVWFWHETPEEVTDQEFLRQTRIYLLDIAKERNIPVEDNINLHPAKLAHTIFSKIVPELKL